jgi:hypothetical protein
MYFFKWISTQLNTNFWAITESGTKFVSNNTAYHAMPMISHKLFPALWETLNKLSVLAVTQEISSQCKCFEFIIFNFHKNSSDLTTLLCHYLSTQSPPQLRHLYHIFYSCSYESMPCYQPPCHNCFNLLIIIKFTAAMTQLQSWKEMIIPQGLISKIITFTVGLLVTKLHVM